MKKLNNKINIKNNNLTSSKFVTGLAKNLNIKLIDKLALDKYIKKL